jgi:transposase
MRGKDERQLDVFSYVSPEQRVPQDHPLRPLRVMTDGTLTDLQPRFNKLYAKTGRPSIAPEKLLRALLLQALYSVRSERMLMEQLDYNLLFRSFVGLNMDDPIWDVTVFTKNRERLLDGDIAEAFFQAVLKQARERSLLSDEHFTVGGTLLEAWASLKSFQRKNAKSAVLPDDPGNATLDFHGERRSNETHESKTDPFLYGLVTLARNVTSRHDHLGARENAVHFFGGNWNVLERAYDGGSGALLEDRAPRGFQNSKRKEFFGKLGPQRISGYDDKEFLAFRGDENRQHRLRFASACRHHDRCRRI